MNLKIILSWTVVLFFVVNNVLGQIGIGGPYGGYFFDPNDPIVQTNFGPVRGEKFQPGQSFQNNRPYANGLSYVQFIGIPYGAPPVGENRFRPPHFPPIWTNTLDCSGRKRIMCPQVYQRFPNIAGIREDEDCLHLNIYIPVDNRPNTIPVLVYIHGGEFRFGGKDFYKPDLLLQAGNNAASHFIIVTINYRLGVLGFLSTDDFNCPGNNGIRDQALALQWIHENIAKFGGNPANVTIMGHDAGGASVSFHLLNQGVNQYFSNAISISGSVFSPWAIHDNPLAQARDFAHRFSCGYRQDQIVECLRYQDLRQLMAVNNERDWEQNRQPFWFRPVVDRNVSSSALLRDFPLNLYKNGQFNKKPYLVIVTGREGSLEYYLQSGRMPQGSTANLEQQISFLIRPYLRYYTNELIMADAFEYRYFNRTQRTLTIPQNVLNNNPSLIQNQYTLNNQINTGGYNPFSVQSNANSNNVGYTQRELDQLFSEMLGDFLFVGPVDYAVRLHSAQAQAMMLVFDYVGQRSFGIIQNDVLQQVNIETYGATHFNDIFYLLPNEYDPSGLSNLELNVALQYCRFIGEFVLHGFSAQTRYVFYTAASPNYQILTRTGQLIPQNAHNQQGYRTTFVDFINNFIYKLQDSAVIFPPYFPQQEFKSYQQATWSLLGVLIFILIIAIILAIILIVRKRREHQEDKEQYRHDSSPTQVKVKQRFDD
ncbi:esterase-5B-like [Dermatophagoides pteronyssinus]|uniref:esterase-5B-like n=1 Tax=Dermatophagoides pteronyssinus TaxID=6956 RepID=UPI003F6677EF